MTIEISDSQSQSRNTAIVSSAHLADEKNGWQLSELEYAMTMAYNAFSRWMMQCMGAIGCKDFNPLDVLVLHNVNHRGREKRLTDITFMLNIEDIHTVSYSLKKLVKADFVTRRKVGKEIFYSTSKLGQQMCEQYRDIRRTCLLGAVEATGRDYEEIRHAARVLRNISGLYDQASRSASSL